MLFYEFIAGGNDMIERIVLYFHSRPVPVIKSGKHPSFLIFSRIESFSVIYFRTEDGTGGTSPVPVGDNGFFAAVRITDFKLCKQSQFLTVNIMMIAPGKIPAVPSGTQQRANYIFTRPYQAGNIVCLVLQPLVITRKSGRKKSIPGFSSVYERFV